MSIVDDKVTPRGTTGQVVGGEWESYDSTDKTYRFCVYLKREDDGYYVRASELVGVVSEGDTEEEAIENITDAYQGVLLSYREHNEPIPWSDPRSEKEADETARWIEVHA